jgi:hypothetical protein
LKIKINSIFIDLETLKAIQLLNSHEATSYENDNDKIIFNSNGSPNILYNRENNIIIVQLAYKNNDNIIDFYNFNCDEFESQSWINLTLCINNRKANLFKNGILYKSTLLPNVHLKSYKRYKIGDINKNFNGYIANIDYYNYILNKHNILKLYNKNINIL